MEGKEHRSAAKTVFVVMLIVELLIVLTIFMLTIVFSSADSTPSFMGQSFYISDIAKMDESIKVNSLVVAKNGRPNGSIVGGVILCENISGFGTGVFRVVGVESNSDTFIYKVCLDGAPTQVFDIDAKNVVGECKYSYYTLGKMILFVKSKFGVVVCVVIPALLLALIELMLGFSKELRRRELQKKRETVKKEQAKRYSTKRKREKAFSVDDFKNEDVDLKRKHLKSNRNDHNRPRRAVRALSTSEDAHTRLMDISPDRQTDSGFDDSDEVYVNKAAGVADMTQSYTAPEYAGVPGGNKYADAKTIYDIREAKDQSADVNEYEPAKEETVTEPVQPPKPKKPSMSLEDMMKLMKDQQEKLQKDIEKNKTKV